LPNRWLILVTAMMATFCIGGTYSFSIFAKPLMNQYSWSPSQVSLLFTIVLVMMPITMTVAGKVQDLRGPQVALAIAGIAYASSWFFSAYVSSLTALYLIYGVLGGLGNGAIYSCAVVNTVKWFPDKRGLAAGLTMAGSGVGVIVLAPFGTYLMQSYGVLATFQIFGAIFVTLVLIAAYFAKTPPADYRPAGWTPPAPNASSSISTGDKTWREMMSDPIFYVVWIMFVACAISGLMIIGHAATIGVEAVKLTPAVAAVAVSFLGFSNTIGRILWGWISDHLGRYATMTIMFVISGAGMLLIGSASTFISFVIAIVAISSCFGGFFALFPPITGDMFGMKNFGTNWGILFTAYAPAAIIGPILAAKVKEANNGDYTLAFLVAAVICAVGAVLTLYCQYQIKKRREALSIGQVS